MPQMQTEQKKAKVKTLTADERIYHRDRLRTARYAALADSEGFLTICFALESLGLRLSGSSAALGQYRKFLKQIAGDSIVLSELTEQFPSIFTKFDALFELVLTARNDAMHSGVYARHATSAAIEMCIGLEAAVMKEKPLQRRLVVDYMVKSPITVQRWAPVAHARQLMLTHSFSYLPVEINGWKLVSEIAMARYLQLPYQGEDLAKLLATSIEDAVNLRLKLVVATVVKLEDEVQELLKKNQDSQSAEPRLWLVVNKHAELCGVLSPFELM